MTGSADRRPIAARRLGAVQAIAAWLVRRGASPNGISLLGMAAAMLAGLAFAGAWTHPAAARPLWLIGAALVQLRLAANLFDGMVAIGRGVASPVGELYNEVPDRVSDTAVLVGLGLAAHGDWPLGLAAAMAAMSTAYVRAVGRAAGTPSDFRGPMAKQHRMALVTTVAVWCALTPLAWGTDLAGWGLPWLALIVITALSLLTAARRLLGTAAQLRGRAAP